MPLPSALHVTRRTALAASVVLAWRPLQSLAAERPEDSGDSSDAVLHVLNRLGFGPAPGDVDRVTRMGAPAWIHEQLHPERLALPSALAQALGALQTPGESQRELVRSYREMQQAAKQAKQAQAATDAAPPPGTAPAADAKPVPAPDAARAERRGGQRGALRGMYLEAGEARLLQALSSPRQLEEVMVAFWFNHFNVYEGKGLDRVLVENYEREAIRPGVFGRFRDLLGATAKHPAMLFYLDNWLSVAPGYQPRRPGGRPLSGLNENYAREVMELHTLGVDGGYTQQDVTELARILTGWTMTLGDGPRRGRRRDEAMETMDPGDSIFGFDPARHDNGTKTWLGHTVTAAGQAEGEFALDVLARHPATARHISTQLARHFVADDPPPALVNRLARRFLDADGDIRAVLTALFDSPEFRDPRPTKFKTPYEYVLSAVRAAGIPVTNVRPLLATLSQLGQPLYGCQTPDGYKDTEADWLNPAAVTQRVNFATALASGRLPLRRTDDTQGPGDSAPVDVTAVLATLGPMIGARTRATVSQSDPALRAALVLGSPDFMRR